MADTAGQADIRGLYIDKKSKDYLDESLIFKKLVTTVSTPSREVRWYQKTSGFLTMTSPATFNVAEGARPFVLEQSWTRNTSYAKKWFVESPWITMEDEADSDVKIFTDNLKDLTQAVAYDLDSHIWDIVSESQSPTNINSVTATGTWDAASGQDPFEDIMEARQLIREQTKRRIRNGVLLVSAKGEKDLLVWIVSTKGASIPSFSSQKVESGSLLNIAGLDLVVSENVTADYAMVADLAQACEYREFKPLTTGIKKEEGIGRKIRVWTHGIAILVKPKYVSLISNTEA